ncbi:toll/interleukin-1 receptor domain-containing protein [Lentzea sp. BCCO 10_0798]|uniref:Toll/interleukin-1 receptor domain-containing protein n=1 Tax=Lentzea kristufekii TaxID=3095430 RepID=A0ABU4U1A6_9PSEU|nr:toll/interleukin-1 receptor domain-containing protein [Lentzea sp. BCCO 10_0798]MDX8054351.1 toll/interleukin-1 receptor domain-containing protein [Lentzea sp. BCCO 10_0798]
MQATSIPLPRCAQGSAALDQSRPFDVFVAYNSADLTAVLDVCAALREQDINPWIDVERVRPGTWVQDAIEEAISSTRTAAVFLGQCGAGRWQRLEIRAFVERCATDGIPLVPVLLPEAGELPLELLLLRQLNFVQFRGSVRDPEALRRLRWGITGVNPSV